MATATNQTLTLPLLPLTTGVVLPGMVVTVALESAEARAAVDAAGDGRVLLVPRVDGRYARVGTVATITETGTVAGGVRTVAIEGVARAVIGTGVAGTGAAVWVTAEVVAPGETTERARTLAREYRAVIENILEIRGASGVARFLRDITDADQLADTAGYSPDLSFERKVEVLETLDVEERLEKVLRWSRDVLGDLTLKERIRNDVADGMEKAQREYLLRQQLAAIRKELGEDGGDAGSDYRERLAARELPLDVRTAVEREIEKLERTPEQSPEHGWIRTWLDTVLEIPWGVTSDDVLDIGHARAVLDADHTGLDDVKERMVEHLAVRRLRAERGISDDGGRGAGAIIALVGPPGVGKTSLGESVGRALGRRFVRVALGGVRDEAEIRGHRRTYVGAQPGRIARALREAGTMNPVILLDEVDKLGNDWRGDPSSALLEVLDPAQNHTFRDHYLEVDLDLSDVLFLATANVLEMIPAPLLDRMEVVRLDGYTDEEKVAIARDHLVPRQRVRNGLRVEEVDITDAALRTVVTDYTREAGVRTLERELARLLRKVATAIAGSEVEPPVVVEAEAVRTYLGRARYFPESAERTAVPGVATGLAVTGAGGDVLFIEATAIPLNPVGSYDGGSSGSGGSGGSVGSVGSVDGPLTITGQLGDVMRESAEIALSYVKANASDLGIGAGGLTGKRFHVHVPAGAVPKDGPSAGITMTAALVSLITGRPVRAEVGMTGEVTLSGRVLPIGGVKQKVLAAHRAGLSEVILPMRNRGDVDDVPEPVREAMTFHFADDIGQVLEVALEG